MYTHQQNQKQLRRGRLSSHPKDIGITRSCASLRCDVDARITCGGKTFETKFPSTKQTEQHRKPDFLNVTLKKYC